MDKEKLKNRINELIETEGRYHYSDVQKKFLGIIIDTAFKEAENESRRIKSVK